MPTLGDAALEPPLGVGVVVNESLFVLAFFSGVAVGRAKAEKVWGCLGGL